MRQSWRLGSKFADNPAMPSSQGPGRGAEPCPGRLRVAHAPSSALTTQPGNNRCEFPVQGTSSSLPYLHCQSIEERWSHDRARPVSVAARQGRARRMGAPRQGRSGWCRTFAGRPSLGRSLDGQDAGRLLHPGLPEGDGRGRRDAGSDRRRHLLRQPYCRRQRRLRVAVGATALLRPALRFGVGAHSGQRAVADRADAPAQRQICSDRRADHQRNGGHGSPGRG